ncbi:MAG: hypothetical protein EAY72_09135 [Bacteroidetes bacterium]|nr:MAG: hypothetical protein EAY72_09135 [Bacteroidota bacterium]
MAALPLLACDCLWQAELSPKDIANTYYIALVKIKTIEPLTDTSKQFSHDHFYKIIVDEITHYKGPTVKEIIVQGGHYLFNKWGSCDLGATINQEWIVLAASIANQPTITYCTRSKLYKDADGLKDWQHLTGIQEINVLNTYFEKSNAPTITNGLATTFYPDGKVEQTAHYKNGQLHGTVQYYHPKGWLIGTANYHYGKLDGTQFWYFADGKVESKQTFRRGIPVDSTIRYSYHRDIHTTQYIYVYNRAGKELNCKKFTIGTTNPVLENESIYKPRKQWEKTIYYHPNGQVASVSYRKAQKDFGTYTEYDTLGNITRQWNYDEKGRAMKR